MHKDGITYSGRTQSCTNTEYIELIDSFVSSCQKAVFRRDPGETLVASVVKI